MRMKHKMTVQTVFSQEPVSLGCIGRVGENIARQILFDCTDALSGRDAATIACVVRRPGDNAPYSVALEEVEDGVFGLSLTRTEVARSGKICIELRMIDGEEVLKSAIYTGNVERAITGSVLEEVGSPAEDLLDRLETAVAKAEAAPKAYELIEMITVEEDDVTCIIRTAEPNGTPLDLDAAYIRITPSEDVTGNATVYLSAENTVSEEELAENRIVYAGLQQGINTSGNATHVRIERAGGLWREMHYKESKSGYSIAYCGNVDAAMEGTIKTIRMYVTTTNAKFVAGTKIEIWGVRA